MLIETERLVMRRWRDEDAEPLASLNAHPEVLAWLGPAPTMLAEAQDYIRATEQHFDEQGFGLWAIERRDDRRLIGFCGLRRVEWADHPMAPCVEAGWRLARPAWGCGYATEAAAAALGDGFDRCGLDLVLAWTAATNLRSQGVMRRLGMERAERLDFDHPALAADHPLRRHIVFSATRETSSRVRSAVV